jgi:Fe-S cluster biogenesis protein NfuA
MKQYRIFILTIAVFVLVASIAQAGAKDRNESRKSTKVLTVEMLTKSPAKFVGQDVTVKGVVGTVSSDKKLFTIVDSGACGGCPSKRACATPEFKVTYKGELPKKLKIVQITGRLVEHEKGQYLLEASKVQ